MLLTSIFYDVIIILSIHCQCIVGKILERGYFMAKEKNTELKRVNMNLPISLVERVQKYGESLGLNTTSAYIVLLNQALSQQETLSNLPLLMEAYKQAKQDYIENK